MNKKCSYLLRVLLLLPFIVIAQMPDDSTDLSGLSLTELIDQASEHFSDIDSVNLDALLERIGDSRVVLLGEASHGTAEYYNMRARITRELIQKKGFNIIALEVNWPGAERMDSYIRGTGHNPLLQKRLFSNTGFSDFPSWMWSNHSILSLIDWLKEHNRTISSASDRTEIYGLDIYNAPAAIHSVLNYLRAVDPNMAKIAKRSYTCLNRWFRDPSRYSRDMQSGRYRGCDFEVLSVWQNLLQQPQYQRRNAAGFFSAVMNARMVLSTERNYRNLYNSKNNSWNQRDQHMYDTLQAILNYRGSTSKAVIWAHNLHTGDARAMQMSDEGVFNLGQRVRENFGDQSYLVGFGTNQGTVAAALKWGAAMQVMPVPPARVNSYEHLFHQVKAEKFLLPLRETTLIDTKKTRTVRHLMRNKLLAKRKQRSIGVTYNPETEIKRNYAFTSLPRQFDEYIWFDKTWAVTPLH